MPFLEETAELSSLSPTGPNSNQRDMTRGNRDVTNRFTGYYSNINYINKYFAKPKKITNPNMSVIVVNNTVAATAGSTLK